MAGERPSEDPRGPKGSEDTDLIGFLAEFVRSMDRPRFLRLTGAAGMGKSTLMRALIARLPSPRFFVAYLPIPATPGTKETSSDVAMLVADPQAGVASDPVPPSPTPEDPAIPPTLAEPLRRLTAKGAGFVFVDSWDRGSEAFFRSQVPSPDGVRTFTAPASSIGGLRMGILSTPAHLVIAMTPEAGAPLLSTADAVVDLHETVHEGVRLRLATVSKTRGGRFPSNPDYLYSLEHGRFRAMPNLPKGFRMPVGPADPDPEPSEPTIWPGSSSFATAFGRLRTGGFSGLAMSNDCPDTLPHVLAVPMATHVLRSGGRVVWVPAPSVRPSRIVGYLSDRVPADWTRERLRIVSASGDDPALGELRGCILPLRREVSGTDLRTANAPGVGPLFPDVHRFLRDHAPSTHALYVLSIAGPQAAVDAAGQALDATTLPVIFGTYARIPGFHGFGFGRAQDPLVATLRSTIDTLLNAELVLGRPVVSGIRPSTGGFLVDWPGPDDRYELVPVR